MSATLHGVDIFDQNNLTFGSKLAWLANGSLFTNSFFLWPTWPWVSRVVLALVFIFNVLAVFFNFTNLDLGETEPILAGWFILNDETSMPGDRNR